MPAETEEEPLIQLSKNDRNLVQAAIHLVDAILPSPPTSPRYPVQEGVDEALSTASILPIVDDVRPGHFRAETDDTIGAHYDSPLENRCLSGASSVDTPQISHNAGPSLDMIDSLQRYVDEAESGSWNSELASSADLSAQNLAPPSWRIRSPTPEEDSQNIDFDEPAPTIHGETDATPQTSILPDGSTGDVPRSTPEFRRLGVRLLRAADLVARQEIDPFVEVRVEGQTRKAQAISKNANPEWNDFLVFNVRNPSVAALKVKVIDGVTCCKNVMLGEVQLSVSGFVMDPEGSKNPRWYELAKKGKSCGKIMMQIFYLGEREHRPLRVTCCTWNVGNAEPSDNLRPWFRNLDNGGYDLIAVGVQECSYKAGQPPQRAQSDEANEEAHLQDDSYPESPGSPMNEGGGRRRRLSSAANSLMKALEMIPQDKKTAWEDLVKDAIGEDYWMVKSIHMRQIRLIIFASNDIYPAISCLKHGSQATGVGGVGQNKGGLAIAMQVWDTELCFVNSHLAAHQDKTRSRNTMYGSIIRGLRMDAHQMDIITGHHHVFWMGDLNYRVKFGEQANSPTDEEFSALVDICHEKKIADLLELDQLKEQIATKQAFYGFKEGDIKFMPTYKVERVAGHVWNPQRLPAWCDRVLWRSAIPAKDAIVMDYYSVPEISSSDHKPVGAYFLVPSVFYNYQEEKEDRGKVVVVVIKQMVARGLFMLKNRSRKNVRAPNPQVIIDGPGIKQHRTSVVPNTREPTWRAPIRLKFKESELQHLVNYRLMFRVVSSSGRGRRPTHTLGRGVLAFDQVLTGNARKNKVSFTFRVVLQYNGLPAGTLGGDVKASLKSRRIIRRRRRSPPEV